MHKGCLLRLLHLKPEKELQSSHHRQLEFFAHVLYNPHSQKVRRAAKKQYHPHKPGQLGYRRAT
jgi:hypothetical protein